MLKYYLQFNPSPKHISDKNHFKLKTVETTGEPVQFLISLWLHGQVPKGSNLNGY